MGPQGGRKASTGAGGAGSVCAWCRLVWEMCVRGAVRAGVGREVGVCSAARRGVGQCGAVQEACGQRRLRPCERPGQGGFG